MSRDYYAVIEIRKVKSFKGLSAQEAHNNREYPMNHVDDNLTYLNRDIVSTGGSHYTERWKDITEEKELISGKKIKVRCNSVLALDIVTAMSPGAESALKIDINEWCEANKKWMENTFGASNIIAMTLHMDETDNINGMRRGVHIHTLIVPIDDRGHLCASSYVNGRYALKNLWTSYAKDMKQFGLVRGENGSKIHHTDRKRWYGVTARLTNEKAPRINDGETMEDYLARLDNIFQERMIAAQKEIDKYEKKYERSETRQAQIFSEYAYAVNLQHILEEEYGGDMKLVNERLKNYQMLEKAVPRKNLSVMIDKMIEKYPPENSLACFRKGKKKKHKKWESLEENIQNNTDTNSSGSNNPVFIPEDEEKEIVFGSDALPNIS